MHLQREALKEIHSVEEKDRDLSCTPKSRAYLATHVRVTFDLNLTTQQFKYFCYCLLLSGAKKIGEKHERASRKLLFFNVAVL